MMLRHRFGDAIRNWGKIGGVARGVCIGRTERRWDTMNVQWPSHSKPVTPREGWRRPLSAPMARAIHFLRTRRLCATTKENFSARSTLLIDITERKRNEEAAQHYSAIVESSDDAILSKDVNGVITSWNSAARRLFGYTAQEAVGKSVTMLIPADRQDEEPRILERIRRGEKIDHYETIRQRKDGRFVDISLTVSPIRDLRGNVIGASKIARDISDRKRAEERQDLLLQRDGSSHQEPVRIGDRHRELERPFGEERPGSRQIRAGNAYRLLLGRRR